MGELSESEIIWTVVVPAVADDSREWRRSLVALADVFPSLLDKAVASVAKQEHRPADCALVLAAECGAVGFAEAMRLLGRVDFARAPHLRLALETAAKANGRSNFLRWLALRAGHREAIKNVGSSLIEACRDENFEVVRWLITLLPDGRVSQKARHRALQALVDFSQRGNAVGYDNLVRAFELEKDAKFRETCARCCVEACSNGHLGLAVSIDAFHAFRLEEIETNNYQCFRLAVARGYAPVVEWLLDEVHLDECEFSTEILPSALKRAFREGQEEIARYLINRFAVPKEDFAGDLIACVLIKGDLPRAQRLAAEMGLTANPDVEHSMQGHAERILFACADHGRSDVLDWFFSTFDSDASRTVVQQTFGRCLPGHVGTAQAIARLCNIDPEACRTLCVDAMNNELLFRRVEATSFEHLVSVFALTKADLLPRLCLLHGFRSAPNFSRNVEWFISRFAIAKEDILDPTNRIFEGQLRAAEPGKAVAWLIRRFGLNLREVEALALETFGRLSESCCEEELRNLLRCDASAQREIVGKAKTFLSRTSRGPIFEANQHLAGLRESLARRPKTAAAWMLVLRSSAGSLEELCEALERL